MSEETGSAILDHEIITFFMPVTDRDAIIADYAIASYRRLKSFDIPFKLLIYPNYLSPGLKKTHFQKWQQYDYVEIMDTHLQDAVAKPSPWEEASSETAERFYAGQLKSNRKAYVWEGPWERHDLLLDRELKRINSPYVASVDADFEILSGDFVVRIIEEMDRRPNLKVMSSDYSPTVKHPTKAFTTGYCYLWERYHTWFCVYKREVLDFPESHRYRDMKDETTEEFWAWDTSAVFQQRLRDELGYEMQSVSGFDKSFIHYAAFSKNRTIGRHNLWLYRVLKLAPKRPLLRQQWTYLGRHLSLLARVDRRLTSTFGYVVAPWLLRLLFNEREREQPLYVDVRGQPHP